MPPVPPRAFVTLPRFILLFIALLLLRAALAWPGMPVTFITGDNDDLMRLVVVRDWLGGQGWFDTTQYRILPPEGISMHWSRYVDAGIAALLLPLSAILPPASAEMLTVTLWPTLLACLLMVITGIGTHRLLGLAAAVGAMAMALTWSRFGGFEFAPGRIDHHNVQLLCATAVVYLSLVPGRNPARNGALAGAATAFSLAVGLEMVPLLALLWALAALRHAFGLPGAGRWLTGYALTIALAAPLLMAGQVPRAQWWVAQCDELAPPVLALLTTGVVATLAPVVLGGLLRKPVARILLVAVLTAAGMALAWPLLGPCLPGPYADVTPEARAIIDTRITEARPVLALLADTPDLVAATYLPGLAILVLAGLLARRLWPGLGLPQRLALVQALVIAGAGLLFALTQIRATNLAAPAILVLTGFVVKGFVDLPRTSRIRAPLALVLLLAMPITIEMLIITSRSLTAPAAAMTAQAPDPLAAPGAAGAATAAPPVRGVDSCRSQASMAELAALPPGVVFTTLNLGTAVLAYTGHSATAAPYHRSGAAFWNGIGPFQSEPALRAALLASGADHLALCRLSKAEMGQPAAQALLTDPPDWLRPVAGPQSLLVFAIDRAALAAAEAGTP